MRNIALLIEYDGTAYGGWQIQKNSRSIQAVLEGTLTHLLQEEVKVIGAGRTDSGVHAYGQVANFRTERKWETGKLLYALNGTLPEDIAIIKAAEVHESFHARFDAVGRKYIYRVVQRKTPILRDFAAFVPYGISVEKMNEAASFLIGRKSFKSFTKYADQQRSFICDVTKAEWKVETGRVGDWGTWRQEEEKDDTRPELPVSPIPPSPHPPFSQSPFLQFEIEANRFLHGMVRAIVGTLIDVGRGKIAVIDFVRIMETEERSLASMSAPACGLFLKEVKYGFDIWEVSGNER